MKDRVNYCNSLSSDECFKELEHLSQKLINAEKSRDRFLSLIRNEFDNPLVSMTSLMKILEKSLKGKEEYETFRLVYLDMLKLNYQLNNIVAMAAVETGVLEKNLSMFSIKAMLDDIDDALLHLSENKHFIVLRNFNCADELYHDRDKIYTILLNLIGNAYEYSTSKTEIVIDVFEDDNKLFFSVKNRGDKIKDPDIIFDAFYQENEGYARAHQGLGVGLSVVGAFVDFLGGEIFVTREGDFNVFVVHLPVCEPGKDGMFGSELDGLFFD